MTGMLERSPAFGKSNGQPMTTSQSEATWVETLKALADKTRLRIVALLLNGADTVNHISERLDVSQYNISKHLRILRRGGIVGLHQNGRQREYFILEEFRQRLAKDRNTLDLGCCTFRFDRLSD